MAGLRLIENNETNKKKLPSIPDCSFFLLKITIKLVIVFPRSIN